MLLLLWMEHGKNMDTLLFLVLLWLLLGKLEILAWEILSKHCTACKLREDVFGGV